MLGDLVVFSMSVVVDFKLDPVLCWRFASYVCSEIDGLDGNDRESRFLRNFNASPDSPHSMALRAGRLMQNKGCSVTAASHHRKKNFTFSTSFQDCRCASMRKSDVFASSGLAFVNLILFSFSPGKEFARQVAVSTWNLILDILRLPFKNVQDAHNGGSNLSQSLYLVFSPSLLRARSSREHDCVVSSVEGLRRAIKLSCVLGAPRCIVGINNADLRVLDKPRGVERHAGNGAMCEVLWLAAFESSRQLVWLATLMDDCTRKQLIFNLTALSKTFRQWCTGVSSCAVRKPLQQLRCVVMMCFLTFAW